MFHVRPIDSLDLPELAPYRTMRRSQEHCDQGIFVAEGEKVVRRLLESRFPVLSVLLPAKWVADYEPLLQARSEDIPVFITEKQLLEQLTGFSMFQGVLAIGRIPGPARLEDVLARSEDPPLLVAIEGLTNAENLGALVRNCVAFHARGLIVGETSASPYLRRAVRNSMGAIFHLPVIETRSLMDVLHDLGRRGIHRIAAHPHARQETLSRTDFRRSCCIVFGSEGYGLSPAVLEACDDRAAVPMPPTVDSLNVAAAAAVFLYEVCRQRGKS